MPTGETVPSERAVLASRGQRTVRDIVQAAISCWGRDGTASLGEVARNAGVGRTTLNRHFTDRAALVAAVDAACMDLFTLANQKARPEEGTGLSALQRLCVEYVDLGDVLGLVFADNPVVDPDRWGDHVSDHGRGGGTDTSELDPLSAAVARGQADGSIDVELPTEWVGTLAWTSLYAAWLGISTEQVSRQEAARLLTRTLTSGVQS